MRRLATAGVCLAVLVSTGPALAQGCHGGAGFADWLNAFKREAVSKGVSQRTVASALQGAVFDKQIVALDRRQSVFAQDFLTFAGRMVAQYRLQQGAAKIKQMASTFARIEKQYGVPAPVLVAFWGLETDFGANVGDRPTLRSLVTMAYDCRRPDLFREQLLAALRIIDRGDLSVGQMIGPWAGELGQLQFLPAHYLEYGVDFNGDGRVDLLRTPADALASGGHYMAKLGWRRGEPWLQEVRLPADLPWDQADIAIEHPRAQWVEWGVAAARGKLAADDLKASLLLPMGRNGPAFLAYPNFRLYLEWNESLVYATTAAYFATRLAGAPPVDRGRAKVNALGLQQTRELQQILSRAGYDVGKIDGIIGAQTRAAVKAVQQKLDLPADSYPTAELLSRLRRR